MSKRKDIFNLIASLREAAQSAIDNPQTAFIETGAGSTPMPVAEPIVALAATLVMEIADAIDVLAAASKPQAAAGDHRGQAWLLSFTYRVRASSDFQPWTLVLDEVHPLEWLAKRRRGHLEHRPDATWQLGTVWYEPITPAQADAFRQEFAEVAGE